MYKTIVSITLLMVLFASACSPTIDAVQPTQIPTEQPAPTQEPTSTPESLEQDGELAQYSNPDFGLSFDYPSTWYGPEEYIVDDTIRVEIGSDVVYPYGTDRTEQVQEEPNAYYIVIQFSKNNPNTFWTDTYDLLGTLKDGESSSGMRSMTIRIREVNLGNLSGYEYISTLSETAQTERIYSRNILLVDDQSNILTILGSPTNVEVADGSDWRAIFQQIDEDNLPVFQDILSSITVE